MFENVPKDLVGDANEVEPVREVCILPFPLTDVLLQGETKELCLYEERYVGVLYRSLNTKPRNIASKNCWDGGVDIIFETTFGD